MKQRKNKLKKEYIRINSPTGKKRRLLSKMKKRWHDKKQNAKQKHKTEKTSVKESAEMKTKIKKKITFSQCVQVGHSKTLCPFIKPKIGKEIISKHMRVDWTVPMYSVFDFQTESNKYHFLIDCSK